MLDVTFGLENILLEVIQRVELTASYNIDTNMSCSKVLLATVHERILLHKKENTKNGAA